jgi:hypothetical protein
MLAAFFKLPVMTIDTAPEGMLEGSRGDDFEYLVSSRETPERSYAA